MGTGFNGMYINLDKIKGIGPIKLSKLKNMGINSTKDLLYHFPRDYEDLRTITLIKEIDREDLFLIKVRIIEISGNSKFMNSSKYLKWVVKDNTSEMEIIFFNAGFSIDKYKKGDICFLYGKTTFEKNKFKMLHPKLIDAKSILEDKILPIYPTTLGISQNDFRKWTKQVLNSIGDIGETLSEDTIQRNRLCSIDYGLRSIHFPKDEMKIKEAKYRFIFEELLYLQLGLVMVKNFNAHLEKGIAFEKEIDKEKILSELPFKLTNAQNRVIEEIFHDMKQPKTMNRLIQGDVGSGKTIVAAMAIIKAIKNGYQAVLMAPTQILAMQHENTMKNFLGNNGIKVKLLTSNISLKDRRELLLDLSNGEIDLIIGTHSIIQDDVKFKNLGLVITDEQHRFGVNQRFLLTDKAKNPDRIVMTATPIPRTLALIVYGDLDISIIDELPLNRKKIITKAFNQNDRKKAYEFLNSELKNGRQAFVVSPIIDEDESENPIKSAKKLFDELKELDNLLKGYKIGLLHGKLKEGQKNNIMLEFQKGNIDVLVSTVIIEVGIDIQNATVMLIESAERFGLSQLHQLRGRVGRGDNQSYCFLLADCKSSISKERIETMVETSDGFVIAQRDLKLRGPGDFFGTKQHGLPELKIADLIKHIKIVSIARQEAQIILEDDQSLSSKKNQIIRNEVSSMYKESFISTL
jgi:ATP-dependent DNA helicase RecG